MSLAQRIVVCYNKRSSRFREISSEVLEPIRRGDFSIQGRKLELCEFEITQASVLANARRLAKVVRDKDIVISAGGDGTATATLNGVI